MARTSQLDQSLYLTSILSIQAKKGYRHNNINNLIYFLILFIYFHNKYNQKGDIKKNASLKEFSTN